MRPQADSGVGGSLTSNKNACKAKTIIQNMNSIVKYRETIFL